MLSIADRRLLVLIFATTLTSLMGNSLLAPVIPNILDDFGRPDGDSGLVISSASLPGIFVAPIIGLLADRLGRRAVLTPCLAIFGVAGLGATFAPSFWALLGFRFAMGIGAAGLVNLAIVLIGDQFHGAERTRWVGINAGVLTMALAIFPLLGGGLAEIGGWRLALAPYSLGIVAAIFAWFTLDDTRPDHPVSFTDQLGGAGAVLRQPKILAAFAAAAIMFAVIFGVFLAALPTHLDNEFDLSSGWRGVVLGLPAVSSTVAAFNMARLQRVMRPSTIAIISASLWVVAFLTMGLAASLAVLIVGAMLYGTGEGALIPSIQNSLLNDAPVEHRAVVLASWTASARLGQTIGPLAAGAIIAGASTAVALLGGALISAVLLILFFATRPR